MFEIGKVASFYFLVLFFLIKSPLCNSTKLPVSLSLSLLLMLMSDAAADVVGFICVCV